ncbi:hypothetical protein [Rhizobium sp. LC145]|uniref:hypothetical protein n=1 Tax=Rhizobium sp. LC145 TaxID=1120688 RepID=UPI000629E554|nr:hypothetical protein [Rhizobium sp. LC145]KKX24331.1 hypothetical protein YH62_27675 [Rhizobium sp. LC145]TKT46148.1 hypothetical protein FDR95_23590 [Rhizobiaceae bacterium LC148]
MKKEDIVKQPWFPAIKGSTRDLIAAAGGIDRVSLFLGCGKTVVGNWNNWEMADLMPHWAMIALEADLGRPILSAAYARLSGATVTDGNGAPAGRARSLSMDTANIMHEVSEYLGAHSEALADGEYSLAELRELREKISDIASSLAAAVSTIDRKIAARAA